MALYRYTKSFFSGIRCWISREELFARNFVNHNRGMMMRTDFIGCPTAASKRCIARHCSLVSCAGQVN